MVTINTNLKNLRESARTERVEPNAALTGTTVQGALEGLSTRITNNAVSTPLVLATTTGTQTQALVVNQTLSNSGTSTTSFSGSLISLTNSGFYVDNGNNTTLDTYGLSPMDAGFRINYSAQGGVSYTIHTGLAVGAINTATANQLVGTLSVASSNINTSGTDTLWGIIGTGDAGASANISTVRAIEAELGLHPSATVSQRTGVSIVSFGSGTGSLIDAAVYVYESAQVATGYGNGAPFHDLILMDAGGPNPPVSSNGNIISSRGGSFTVGSIINLPNVTISGNIINSPNLLITGAGVGTLKGPSGNNIWNATTSGGGVASLIASTNTTSGLDGVQVSDASTNNDLFVGVFEANYNTVLYGQTAGNWAAVNAHGSTNAGLMLGTLTSEPVILGSNSTQRILITAAGGVEVGTPTSGDKGTGTLNAQGLYVNGGSVGILNFTSSVNFNSANTDTPISIALPSGVSRYALSTAIISGASTSLTTATLGIFTSTGGGGVPVVPTGAITVSTAAENTNNNMLSLTVTNFNTQCYNAATLYSRVSSAEGVAATANVTISIRPLG